MVGCAEVIADDNPSGFSPSTGVPTGVQLIGKAYDDLTVFRLSAALEAATDWGSHHPTL